MITSLILTLFTAVTARGDAPNACSTQIHALDEAITKAESAESSGHIEGCTPAADPKSNTAHLVLRGEAAAMGYATAYGHYLDAKKRVDTVQADLAAGGGNICGASAQVKADVKALTSGALDALAEMETQGKAFSETEFAFNQQYLRRAGAQLKSKVPNNKQCSSTASNVKILSQMFSRADSTCSGLTSNSSSVVNSLGQLQKSLSGCSSN
jgi:hypothetical protein